MKRTRWISRSLVGLGMASLFSDFGHEMITAVLPAYLLGIGGGALALGLIEGAADALSSVVKLYGGWLADRVRRKRVLIAAGYAVTGILLPFVAVTVAVWQVLALRIVAWMARGFRGPLRDIALVDSVQRRYVTRAFGFHRAMDTLGALVGPLAALVLLGLHRPPAFIIAAAIAPGVLSPFGLLLVRETGRPPAPALAEPTLSSAIFALPKRFFRFLTAAGIFGLGNFSHTLLILLAAASLAPRFGTHAAASIAVALYVLHNVVFAGLAYPMGRLGERFGAARLLVAGYALFACLAVLCALGSRSLPVLVAVFVLAGVYIAIVEPMEPSAAVDCLPSASRGLGLGALASVNGVGDFVASVGVGVLWAKFGVMPAFLTAAGVTALGAFALAASTRTRNRLERGKNV